MARLSSIAKPKSLRKSDQTYKDQVPGLIKEISECKLHPFFVFAPTKCHVFVFRLDSFSLLEEVKRTRLSL